jgi:hypothetical protein
MRLVRFCSLTCAGPPTPPNDYYEGEHMTTGAMHCAYCGRPAQSLVWVNGRGYHAECLRGPEARPQQRAELVDALRAYVDADRAKRAEARA